MKVFPFVLGVILILGIIIPTKVIAQEIHNPLNKPAPTLLGLIILKLDKVVANAQVKNLTQVKWMPWEYKEVR